MNFNRYVSAVDADSHDALLRDLLAAAAARAKVANTDVIGAAAEGAAGTAAGGGLGMASTDQTVVAGPKKKVRYQGETAVAGLLPMARDLVETDAGAVLLDDNPNTDATETAFRPAEQGVATGYAPDVNTSTALAKIDQNGNAKSDNRIAVSSNVKARN